MNRLIRSIARKPFNLFVHHLTQRLRVMNLEVEQALAAEIQIMSELALTLQRTAAQIDQRLARLPQEVAVQIAEVDPEVADRTAASIVGASLSELGPGTSELLNWAVGHTGPSAQGNLWFNPPAHVEHVPGGVRLHHVHERIVELPYAMMALRELAPGNLVLDVGAAESTLALSMACLGMQVIAVDPRGYSLGHPGVHVVEVPIEKWEGPEGEVDAITCISSLEHMGLDAYGQGGSDRNLDQKVMQRFCDWLAPGRELTLSLPYGPWSVDEFQRVYDDAHLARLLEGWTVLDKRFVIPTSDVTWEMLNDTPREDFWDGGRHGVVLLRATPAD